MPEKTLSGFEPISIQAAAFQLLAANPAFMEAALQTERQIIDEWANSGPDKAVQREQAYLKLQVLNEVLAQLDAFYVDATVTSGDEQLQPLVN